MRLRKNVPNGAFVQIVGPNLALKFGPVSLGVSDLQLDASTTGVLKSCGMGALSGHDASIKMPFCVNCDWKKGAIGALEYNIPENLNLRTILTIAGAKELLDKIDIPSQSAQGIVDSFLDTNLADFKLKPFVARVEGAIKEGKAEVHQPPPPPPSPVTQGRGISSSPDLLPYALQRLYPQKLKALLLTLSLYTPCECMRVRVSVRVDRYGTSAHKNWATYGHHRSETSYGPDVVTTLK